MNLKYIITGNPVDCFGCRACEQSCKQYALKMQENEEGFLYPVLDTNSCIDCGLCEKVCPIMNVDKTRNVEGIAYAAQNLDDEDLKTSSSGGIFIAIARYVISSMGVVYGAAYKDAVVCHQRIESYGGLEMLKGSKYVQSDTNNTYQQVKKDLADGKMVLYSGTPCQIAGLNLFLHKKNDNLITIDLVCHGTPSPKIFRETIYNIGKRLKGVFVDYSFRDKKIGGWSCSSSSSLWKRETNKLYYLKYSPETEAYYNAFICGDLMRMSCYHCPFANSQRTGDITLADYWGVGKNNPDFPNIYRGVSLILLNTNKGQNAFSKIKDQIFSILVPIEKAKRTNPNLMQPSPYGPHRDNSYKLAFEDYSGFIHQYANRYPLLKSLRVNVEFAIRSNLWLFNLLRTLKKSLKR